MASPSVRQHRPPTVARLGPRHVRTRLGGGAAYDTVAYALVINNADLWLSSVDLDGAITQWDAKVGTEFAYLGTDGTSETSDPTFVSGTPNTLDFDGSDDRMFVDNASGLDPGDLGDAGGTYTVLVSGVWSSGVVNNDSVVWVRNSAANEYLQITPSGSGTLRALDRPSVGVTAVTSTVTDLADGEVFTAAMVLNGAEVSITVVRDEDAGVRDVSTRTGGGTLGVDEVWLGALNNGAASWPGEISDFMIFSSKALTVAEIESIHDLNRTAAYPS